MDMEQNSLGMVVRNREKKCSLDIERKRSRMKVFLDELWSFAEKISQICDGKTTHLFLWLHVLAWTVPVFLMGCAITQLCGVNFWDGIEIVLTVTGYVGFFGGFTGGVIYIMREH